MKAEALFSAKLKEFKKIIENNEYNSSVNMNYAAIIYAACIIVEGIRNEMEDETK